MNQQICHIKKLSESVTRAALASIHPHPGGRYFLMRAGQGGSDKEGLIQSHPIDKLHMDNRLTEQGVGEVCRIK